MKGKKSKCDDDDVDDDDDWLFGCLVSLVITMIAVSDGQDAREARQRRHPPSRLGCSAAVCRLPPPPLQPLQLPPPPRCCCGRIGSRESHAPPLSFGQEYSVVSHFLLTIKKKTTKYIYNIYFLLLY